MRHTRQNMIMETSEVSLLREIAARIVALNEGPLPSGACDRAGPAIVDTLGVLLAGSRHEAVEILKRCVLPAAGPGQSPVFGAGRRVNAFDAALINGTAGHVLDYDDSNASLHGHASVAVLPAVLSLANGPAFSGGDVLRAFIVGFETASRLGTGFSRYQYTHGWHPTSTVGIFGAVGAAVALLRLSEREIAVALGLVTSMASGIKANFGTMTKPLHVGHAARNALLAVELARGGFTASEDAFDHHHGYQAVYNHGHFDPDRLLVDWRQSLLLLDPGYKQKRFPCCYACLPPLDGLLALQAAHGFHADEIESVRVAVHPIRYPHINVPDPRTALAAKFSLHFCVAQALRNGRLTLSDFEDDSFADPSVRALMGRVTLEVYDHDNFGGAEVSVRLRSGAVHETSVARALGADPREPLPEATVREKFVACASRALAPEGIDGLYERLSALGSVERFEEVISWIERHELPAGTGPADPPSTDSSNPDHPQRGLTHA